MRCPRDPPARPLPGTLNEIETRRDMLLIPSYHPCIPHTKPKCPTHARAHGRLEHVPRLPVKRHRGEPGHTHGTHKRTRGHTDHTDEPHNHPNPTMTGTVNSVPRCLLIGTVKECFPALRHTRAVMLRGKVRCHGIMSGCVAVCVPRISVRPGKTKVQRSSWNPRVPARRRAREKCCRR